MASHMPAWKRLGLKLKYANEHQENLADSQKDRILTSSKAPDTSSELSERPSKRQRSNNLARTTGTSTPERAITKSDQRPPVQRNGVISAETEDSPASGKQVTKRRKSVMFTDDTKVEDGDSRVTIDFPAGSPGQTPKKAKRSDAGTDQADARGSLSPATAGDEGATSPNNRKKTKTGKKSKDKQQQPKDKSNPALEYLHQHRYDHDSWKFNKNREVWILKRALNTDTIPSSHALALAGYVGGMPYQAASRTRLVKECREALSNARLEGDDNEQDRTRLNYLLSNTKSDEAETEVYLQNHSRPAILLWALGEHTNSATNGTSGDPATTQAQKEPMKKKKSRTSAPIDISSSSESEIDSDVSESSSDSEADARSKVRTSGMRSRMNGTAKTVEDTSSSGSSSRSDNGDNDDNSSSSGSSSNSD